MRAIALLALVLSCSVVRAEAPGRTDPKIVEASDAPPASATLADAAWLAGQWVGSAFGGTVEEVWTQPASGSMMGSYRLLKDGKVVFMELLTLTERDGTLALRLKHFNANLTGWEQKDEVREFLLLKKEPGRMYFDGMTFEVEGDRLIVMLRISDDRTGKTHDERFEYRRLANLAPASP